ncbi:ribonuclease H-like domain-containing protein [Tanacetum coccineum]
MAMLTIRARMFIKRTGKKLDINGQRVGFDKSKVECFNCHKHGHFARKCRFPRNQKFKRRENNTRTIAVKTPTQNTFIAPDRIGGYDWSYQVEEEQPINHALMAFTSSKSSSSSDSEYSYRSRSKTGLGYDAATTASPAVESFLNLTDKSGLDKGYHSVPLPLTRNFIPRKPDLTFMDEIVESENLDVTTIFTPCNVKIIEDKGVLNIVESNADRMNNTSDPIIEDWNSDDESEIDYTVRPSTEKIKSVKTVRETEASK